MPHPSYFSHHPLLRPLRLPACRHAQRLWGERWVSTSLPPLATFTEKRPVRHRRERKVFRAEEFLREIGKPVSHVPREERLLQLASTVWSYPSRWLGAAANIDYYPDGNPHVPEVAFVGRRHVGKTSLLRCFLHPNHHTVNRADEAQNRPMMNFFAAGNGTMRLIDTPGYGWVKCDRKTQGRWQMATAALAKRRGGLKHVYLCMDARFHGITERDKSMTEWLLMQKIPFSIIFTHADRVTTHPWVADKIRMTEEERYEVFLEMVRLFQREMHAEHVPMMMVNSKLRRGIGAVMYDIVRQCTKDLDDAHLTLDAMYDAAEPSIPQPLQDLLLARRKAANGEKRPLLTSSAPDEGETPCDSLLPMQGVNRYPIPALHGEAPDNPLLFQTAFLPPADLPEGFFYDTTMTPAKGRRRPRKERVTLEMMTETEELAAEGHPLKGTEMLAKFFPTLAEQYLQKNFAALNPRVKPMAEEHFGMKLPSDLRQKYATPDERKRWGLPPKL